ncbi:MAG: M20/M25/M40 family metallo-hydrolase [Thermovirgaceae bacterium]|nr:M20/M25/M40 family metallo-hydrolase [Thermovirgaceae bacterium]
MNKDEMNKACRLLNDLISIYSPYFKEHEISEFVYRRMMDIGANPVKQEVTEARDYNYKCANVISTLNFDKAETILINAHMDTVYPTEGWTYPPLKGSLVDNEVYGLGSADMKGGLVSLLLTLEECLKRIAEGMEPSFNVVFLASVDEEGPYSMGAKTFIRSKYADNVDFSIVLESTRGLSSSNLSFPAIAHGSRGCYLYEIKVTGKSAHAADPASGANAIDAMAEIISGIKKIPLEKHEPFDDPVSNVIWINGGERALSTPEKCSILVDFHVTPSEDPARLKTRIAEMLRSLNLDAKTEVNYMKDDLGEPMIYNPYLLDRKNRYIDLLAKTCSKREGKVAFVTSMCVGDFNHFAGKGIPTVVLGPDGENLHRADEKVNLADVVKLKDILTELIFWKQLK